MSSEQLLSKQGLRPDCVIMMRPEIASSLKINNEAVRGLVEKTDHFNKFLVATAVASGAFVINPLAGIIMSEEVIRQAILTAKPSSRHTTEEPKK